MEDNYKGDLQIAEDGHIKLDYTLETPEQRNELVKYIIANTKPENLTKQYLDAMATYIILAFKQDIKEHKIITKSRIKNTINLRETSLEGLSVSFENKYEENSHGSAEDYIYNLIIENDKNVILTPREKITQEDIEKDEDLQKIYKEIDRLENQVFPKAKGKQRFSIKENIKALYKDAYVIFANKKGIINCINSTKASNSLNIYENITIDKNGDLYIDSNLSLLDYKHVSHLLCNYSKIKEQAWGRFTSDIYYMMIDLDNLVEKALKDYPVYKSILIYKIDGLQNIDIQKKIQEEHDIKYSVEYLSSLWRNKIPKLIANTAQKEWLVWHFTEEENGNWKRCSKCNCIKLAHPMFFSKNKSSKDGFYSICKDCRNKKKGIQYNG